ncbi:MAG: NAD(P)/FAD-dependent oxidoreductase [Cytophagales bacterium]
MFDNQYDVIVIGGGISGLSYSILMAQKGWSVLVIEKDSYPRHRVCGEYLSLESLSFLQSIGLNANSPIFPIINKLKITSTGPNFFETNLPLGGIGISRYFLDDFLFQQAKNLEVTVLQNEEVIKFDHTKVETKNGSIFHSKLILVSIGKSIGNQKKLGIENQKPKTKFVGVKQYFNNHDIDDNTIELHNFNGGYAGISKVENQKTCFCYLANANSIKDFNGDLNKFEKEVMYKNKFLKNHLEKGLKAFETPLTISNFSFGVHNLISKNCINLGDVAGSISPLCGNGMSMAIHSAFIASNFSDRYLNNKLDLDNMLKSYVKAWKKNFNLRVRAGIEIQQFFGNEKRSSILVNIAKYSPKYVSNSLIKLTHGSDIYQKSLL